MPDRPRRGAKSLIEQAFRVERSAPADVTAVRPRPLFNLGVPVHAQIPVGDETPTQARFRMAEQTERRNAVFSGYSPPEELRRMATVLDVLIGPKLGNVLRNRAEGIVDRAENDSLLQRRYFRTGDDFLGRAQGDTATSVWEELGALGTFPPGLSPEQEQALMAEGYRQEDAAIAAKTAQTLSAFDAIRRRLWNRMHYEPVDPRRPMW